jgi:hypothetical protein
MEWQKDFSRENLKHGQHNVYNKEILSASGGGTNLREIHPTTTALPFTPCPLYNIKWAGFFFWKSLGKSNEG